MNRLQRLLYKSKTIKRAVMTYTYGSRKPMTKLLYKVFTVAGTDIFKLHDQWLAQGKDDMQAQRDAFNARWAVAVPIKHSLDDETTIMAFRKLFPDSKISDEAILLQHRVQDEAILDVHKRSTIPATEGEVQSMRDFPDNVDYYIDHLIADALSPQDEFDRATYKSFNDNAIQELTEFEEQLIDLDNYNHKG